MNSIAPMSTPRVGWPTSSRSGSCSISRASTSFCWLPPEKEWRSSSGVLRADVVAAHPVAAQIDDARRARSKPCAAVVGLGLVAEDRVLVGREALHQADAQPVLRHVARSRRRARLGGAPVIGCATRAGSRRGAAGGCRPAHRAARDWPLPATPAMPTISPARTSKLTPLTRGTPCVVAPRRGRAPRAPARAACGGRLLDPQQHLAPDHQLGQLLLARSRPSAGAPPSRPARITRDLVGHAP